MSIWESQGIRTVTMVIIALSLPKSHSVVGL